MNKFLKLLIPQLLEYFKDETIILEFIPKAIKQEYESLLSQYIKETETK